MKASSRYILFITLFMVSATVSLFAEIPSRYYSTINGKTGAELKNALSTLVYNHTQVSSYSDLPRYFQRTDVYPDSRRWWDMYSDIPLYAPSFSGLNREHAFPKSWWGGLTTVPAYTDLNHLYPSEMAANQAKSNYPLGTVSQSTFDNGVVKIGYAVTGQGGGAARVFEPADQYKGDFARTYFYMVTCYQNLTWNKNYMWMLQQNTYPTLSPWALSLLMKWHTEDPVSQKEIDRNEAIYQIQNNRNPFIDYPSLVDYIWGDKNGEPFYEENAGEPVGDPTLITPVQDMALDFNEVAINNKSISHLYFKGEFLTGKLELVITGTDRAMFSIDTKTIESSLVNSQSGYWLSVTYTPTSTGVHNAKLIISEGGIPGSRGILLQGEGCPVPTLSTFKALPAEDITDHSYVATWEIPNDVVDYYLVSRTRYFQGESSTEILEAETNSLVIDDYDPSVNESYNVRSVRLGYQSEPSNEIYVSHSGITNVNPDFPLGTAYMPGGVRFVCPVPHENVTIYDMQGRAVMIIDRVENNTEVELPVGVYIVTSPTLVTPLKETEQ